MAKSGLWNITTKRMPEGRGVLSQEDGDLVRAYIVLHEENFLSSWLSSEEGRARKRI